MSTSRDEIEVSRHTVRSEMPARAAPPLPRQLPSVIGGFVGRGPELARLDAILAQSHVGTIVIAAIDGTAGVGKTALGLHWARASSRSGD